MKHPFGYSHYHDTYKTSEEAELYARIQRGYGYKTKIAYTVDGYQVWIK